MCGQLATRKVLSSARAVNQSAFVFVGGELEKLPTNHVCHVGGDRCVCIHTRVGSELEEVLGGRRQAPPSKLSVQMQCLVDLNHVIKGDTDEAALLDGASRGGLVVADDDPLAVAAYQDVASGVHAA